MSYPFGTDPLYYYYNRWYYAENSVILDGDADEVNKCYRKLNGIRNKEGRGRVVDF